MKQVVVREHTRIRRYRGGGAAPDGGVDVHLEAGLYDRLKRFDQQERDEDDRVFEWGDGIAKTQQWVGVIQVPGLLVEILPKTDSLGAEPVPDAKEAGADTRRNLLYLLEVAGDVPVRSRDVARLASRRAPLSETLAAIFADRLLTELLRGPEHAYFTREENLRRFKGKLLVSRQTLKNAAHRERFFCLYEEFCDDTLMNRIFRAACRLLLDVTHAPSTQDRLRHSLMVLDQVSDVPVHDGLFDQISITRQNERFADVLRFCRLILAGRSPTMEAGGGRSFSLLFDMNVVFERFVAGFLERHVMPQLEGHELFPQARSRERHLMVCSERGALALKPDLLIEAFGPEGIRRLVLDTKWKRLVDKTTRGGVSVSDLYQLFAYTRRYGCRRSLLLYPQAPGATPRDFTVLDEHGALSAHQVGVRFVNLHRDLHTEAERKKLSWELREMIVAGLGGPLDSAETGADITSGTMTEVSGSLP